MRILVSLSGKELIVKGSRVAVRHSKDYWLATVNRRSKDGTIAVTYDEGTKDPILSLRSVTHLPDGSKSSKKPLTKEQVQAIVEKGKADAAKKAAAAAVKPKATTAAPKAAPVKTASPVRVKTATAPKTAAVAPKIPAAKASTPAESKHVLSDVSPKALASIGKLAHENGSGSNRGSVRSAIESMAKGTASSKDLLTMVQTNNYGGPLASYRASVSKSRIDPDAVDLLKRATAHARKIAPEVVKNESQEVSEQAGKLFEKYKGENGAKAFAKLLKNKHPDMDAAGLDHFTKWFTKIAEKPTVGALASDTATMLSVLPDHEYAAIDKLRDKAYFVDQLAHKIKK